MIWVTVILLGYSAALATLGAAALRSRPWPQRAPNLGVAAWQILSGSVVAATVLSGAVMLHAGIEASTDLPGLLRSATGVVRLSSPESALSAACLAMAVLAGGVAVRAAYCICAAFVTGRRMRSEHLRQLRALGGSRSGAGAIVVDHEIPAAYCLPGSDPAVVLTTAALAALLPEQLAAVLTHERAHIRGRHHIVLAAADGLQRAFPFVPAFRWAYDEQALLLEMSADDAAARQHSRRTVARAMVQMAEGPGPASALAAGRVAAAERVHRLLGPARVLNRLEVTSVTLMLSLVASVPLALALSPVASAGLETCAAIGPLY